MPSALKRPCLAPGCGNLRTPPERYCSGHAYLADAYKAKRPDMRPTRAARGYDADWQRLRVWFLARNPLCQIRHHCSGAPATEVDHIEPLALGGRRLDQSNLQAACSACHKWKTATIDRRRYAAAGR